MAAPLRYSQHVNFLDTPETYTEVQEVAQAHDVSVGTVLRRLLALGLSAYRERGGVL